MSSHNEVLFLRMATVVSVSNAAIRNAAAGNSGTVGVGVGCGDGVAGLVGLCVDCFWLV